MTNRHARFPRIVGLPYDASSSFRRGAADGPGAIRRALHSPAGNMWSEDLQDLGAGGLTDDGDLDFATGSPFTHVIEGGLTKVLQGGHRPIALGGDHSVTFPILRAIHATHGPVAILHVDAHPDLYDEFEGDRLSHACPMTRILEEGLASRLVQVGIRAMTGPQRTRAERYDVEVIDMRAWDAGSRPVLSGRVYMSIDLDGIDPSHAPGVSHREPGGLTVRDVIGLVQGLRGDLVGADVVELNPSQDFEDQTARVAAKLVKELAARMISGERP